MPIKSGHRFESWPFPSGLLAEIYGALQQSRQSHTSDVALYGNSGKRDEPYYVVRTEQPNIDERKKTCC